MMKVKDNCSSLIIEPAMNGFIVYKEQNPYNKEDVAIIPDKNVFTDMYALRGYLEEFYISKQ